MHHSQPKNAPLDLGQIEHFPLITTNSEHYPFGLNERIVYSYLAFRARLDRGESLRAISAATTLNRRTVEKSLRALGSLVQLRKGRWWAVAPTSDQANWFAARKANRMKHWSDGLATIRLLLPKKGARVGRRRFTLNHAALYSELYSFGRRNQNCVKATSLNHMNKLLNGLDAGTIQAGLDLLKAADLIVVVPNGNRMRVNLMPLTDKHGDLFAVMDEFEEKQAVVAPAELNDSGNEAICSFCVSQGIPQNLAVEIAELCNRVPSFCADNFLKMAYRAEHEHLNNRVRGRANARHCGFLLRHKLRDALTVIEARGSGPRVAPLTIEEIKQREAESDRREAEIRANPLHDDYTIDDFSIRGRVQATAREAAQIEDQVHRHIVRYAESKTTNHQNTIRLSGNLYQEVMAHALNRVNGYYNKEKKATVDEFEQAINATLKEREIKPMIFRLESSPQSQPLPPSPKKAPPQFAATDRRRQTGGGRMGR